MVVPRRQASQSSEVLAAEPALRGLNPDEARVSESLVVGVLGVVPAAIGVDEAREGFLRKALHEGGRATGRTRATLHATVAGAPVYARIGFKPNSPMSFYSLQG